MLFCSAKTHDWNIPPNLGTSAAILWDKSCKKLHLQVLVYFWKLEKIIHLGHSGKELLKIVLDSG